MSSPYINTELYTTVPLMAVQMNNNVYLHLKNNLKDKVKERCFKHYGYIVDVYEILEHSDGIVVPESMMGDATYDIRFSCRLCTPQRGTQIVCQIDRAHKILITARNGPIVAIITTDRINENIFFTDNNNNLQYKKGDKSYVLSEKDFVVVTLQSITFHHGDDKIKAIVHLDDVATEEQVKEFYKELYGGMPKTTDEP